MAQDPVVHSALRVVPDALLLGAAWVLCAPPSRALGTVATAEKALNHGADDPRQRGGDRARGIDDGGRDGPALGAGAGATDGAAVGDTVGAAVVGVDEGALSMAPVSSMQYMTDISASLPITMPASPSLIVSTRPSLVAVSVEVSTYV